MDTNLESSYFRTLLIVTTFIVFLVTFVKRKYAYWIRKGVPQLEPTTPYGNAFELLTSKKSFADTYKDVYKQMKAKNKQHAGFYFMFMPQYIPIDLEIIRSIISKDFQYFVNRGVYFNEKDDPLTAHLFAMEGQKWKNLRAKLTPTFTSGKMKLMFPTLVNTCKELLRLLDKSIGKDVEVKDLMARLTTDIIGTCAFGIECNSLHDPDAEFRKYGSLIFKKPLLMRIFSFFSFIWPDLMRSLRVKGVRPDVATFFMKVIKETVSYREDNKIERNDFIDLLLQIKNFGKLNGEDLTLDVGDRKTITVEEIAAQCFVFFIGGFETSSTTLSFCLYELALNESVQEKLRNEVDIVLGESDENLSYESLSKMSYMDMVVNETLRKYPPVPALNRISTKPYNVPNTNVTLDEGVQVIIPIKALHNDPEYYPNPDEFDPDRFTEENKNQRPPYTFLPFGEGPRICLGLRFGLMQTKVALALLLKKYKFQISPKTAEPLVTDPSSFMTSVLGGIWLKIYNR